MSWEHKVKRFSVEPIKERPRFCLMAAFLVGVVLRAVWALLEPITALVLSAAFLYTLVPVFFGTTVELSPDGVLLKTPVQSSKTLPWSRFRAFVSDRNGVFLTPYLSHRRLEGRRGLFLPLHPTDRETVEECCLALGLVRRER